MPAKYNDENAGQLAFYDAFSAYIPALSDVIVAHTDGIVNGNLLEFKTDLNDTPAVLYQAIKYLSKLRMTGRNVPKNILLVDLNSSRVRVFNAFDYRDEIHQTYASSASKDNRGFRVKGDPEIVDDYLVAGASRIIALLREAVFVPIDISQECVVPWAERYYREVPGSTKEHLLGKDGELLRPQRFKGLITAYAVPEGSKSDWKEFERILDRLNDKLKKIELGAFYTPEPYVRKSYELLNRAISQVPEGNDYIVLDRSAGTGNLERYLDEISCPACAGDLASQPHTVLEHTIVNTYEKFEYLELLREFVGRVRSVIPPTVSAGEDSGFGTLLNGDALSDRFILGVPVKDDAGNDRLDAEGNVVRTPNDVQKYLDDEKCTIILFENPPYAEVGGVEAQKLRANGAQSSFSWKESWARTQMSQAFSGAGNGTKAVNDLASVFIWSGIEYYLRQPTDAYIVYSPCKYFKSQILTDRKFEGGFLFNRKRFHATKDAGVSVIYWSNVEETNRTSYPLAMFDIDARGALFPGAVKAGFDPDSGNIELDGDGVPVLTVNKTARMLSDLYDNRRLAIDQPGIACETNGYEAFRKTRGTLLRGDDIIGYLIAQKASFENTDLATMLTRVSLYNGNGFYLRSDNFVEKLPLFAAGRTASEGRYWIRGVVNRSADNGDNFSHDTAFLKSCLIFTALAYHNKCLSFVGSDSILYQNELCFDDDTLATSELDRLISLNPLTSIESRLIEQWRVVLAEARKVTNPDRRGENKKVFDSSLKWGVYQIVKELNTSHPVVDSKGRTRNVADSPDLNGAIKTLSVLLADYHANVIVPKLWAFGLLK